MMETVKKIHDDNRCLMSDIIKNTGLNAINDSTLFAVFVAVHLNQVEVTPEELKEVDTAMKNLTTTGFAESMNCTMSEDDIQEYL